MTATKTLTLAQAHDTRWQHWPPAWRDALRKWWPLGAPSPQLRLADLPRDENGDIRVECKMPKAVGFVATKPRRKGLGPKQLKWLRTNIEAFADMEKRAKASKLVGVKPNAK